MKKSIPLFLSFAILGSVFLFQYCNQAKPKESSKAVIIQKKKYTIEKVDGSCWIRTKEGLYSVTPGDCKEAN